MIKTDRKAALALVDQVDESNRGKVIATLAHHLAIEGKSSWPEIQRLLNSQSNPDERMETMSGVASWIYIRHPNEMRDFFEGVELSTLERSNAIAEAAAVRIGGEPFKPMAGRIAWIKETATTGELDEAIKRATEKLSQYHPKEVEEWIESVQNGPTRDAALDGQVSSLLERQKFDEAVEKMKRITDPNRRAQTGTRIFRHVEFKDPEAAGNLDLPRNSD